MAYNVTPCHGHDEFLHDEFLINGKNSSTTATMKGVKSYTPPLACNCLTYLQDMTEDSGAFRCVPGSHLDFRCVETNANLGQMSFCLISVCLCAVRARLSASVRGIYDTYSVHAPPREVGRLSSEHWAVEGEVAVDGKAGCATPAVCKGCAPHPPACCSPSLRARRDLIVTHCDLLHGSTHNTSGHYRYFISEYVTQLGQTHRDSMDDAAWQPFVARAQAEADVRILRFFGDRSSVEAHQARLEATWQLQVADEQAVGTAKL
eukprot:SAG11_NODE_968_length_6354_cov_16.546922_6_plen_262_part_00